MAAKIGSPSSLNCDPTLRKSDLPQELVTVCGKDEHTDDDVLLVEKIIEKGVDLRGKTACGHTLFGIVSRHSLNQYSEEILALLLSEGADVMPYTHEEVIYDPLLMLCQNHPLKRRNRKLFLLALRRAADESYDMDPIRRITHELATLVNLADGSAYGEKIYGLCIHPNYESVKTAILYINRGGNVNWKHPIAGQTPLTALCSSSVHSKLHLDLLKILKAGKVNPHLKNHTDQEPIEILCSKKLTPSGKRMAQLLEQ